MAGLGGRDDERNWFHLPRCILIGCWLQGGGRRAGSGATVRKSFLEGEGLGREPARDLLGCGHTVHCCSWLPGWRGRRSGEEVGNLCKMEERLK